MKMLIGNGTNERIRAAAAVVVVHARAAANCAASVIYSRVRKMGPVVRARALLDWETKMRFTLQRTTNTLSPSAVPPAVQFPFIFMKYRLVKLRLNGQKKLYFSRTFFSLFQGTWARSVLFILRCIIIGWNSFFFIFIVNKTCVK